jgi:Fe2+-dicitrate sensor, membrane component
MINERDEQMCILLFKQITGKITEEEQLQLEEWRGQSKAHKSLYEKLQDTQLLEQEYKRRKAINVQRPMAEMQRRIKAETGKVFRMHKRQWAIAASIAVLVCVSIVQIFLHVSKDPSSSIPPVELLAASNIKPGETKAVLKMADGSEVALDASEKSYKKAIKAHRNTHSQIQKVNKLNLEVPRGGEFKIVLEDSTEVWLNSESRLTYPETFSSKERRVVVTGEAYFKVTHESGRPFLVETAGQLVKVYGTEFNIKSYEEDKDVFTTLVNGSISLSKLNEKSGELMLTPGHQALFNKEEEETSVKTVNTDIVTSWRHGRFVFEEQNLEQIMQVLSRWYDFEYEFEDEDLQAIIFKGSIPRYSEFNTVLSILEKSGGLSFRLNESTITIHRSN